MLKFILDNLPSELTLKIIVKSGSWNTLFFYRTQLNDKPWLFWRTIEQVNVIKIDNEKIILQLFQNKNFQNRNDINEFLRKTVINGYFQVWEYYLLPENFKGCDYTLLLDACIGGYLEIVKFVFSHGNFNVESLFVGKDEITPFWITCINDHVEVAKYMLSLNSENRLFLDKAYENVLIYGINKYYGYNYINVLKHVFPKPKNKLLDKMFVRACVHSAFWLLDYLIDLRQTQDIISEQLIMISFMKVVKRGELDIVKYLIDKQDVLKVNLTPLYPEAIKFAKKYQYELTREVYHYLKVLV